MLAAHPPPAGEGPVARAGIGGPEVEGWCKQSMLVSVSLSDVCPRAHHWLQDKPGMKIGVVGLGGLGHMAVKFLKAFGCEVTVISTSPGKREEALGHLGAHKFVVSRDEAQVTARPPACELPGLPGPSEFLATCPPAHGGR